MFSWGRRCPPRRSCWPQQTFKTRKCAIQLAFSWIPSHTSPRPSHGGASRSCLRLPSLGLPYSDVSSIRFSFSGSIPDAEIVPPSQGHDEHHCLRPMNGKTDTYSTHNVACARYFLSPFSLSVAALHTPLLTACPRHPHPPGHVFDSPEAREQTGVFPHRCPPPCRSVCARQAVSSRSPVRPFFLFFILLTSLSPLLCPQQCCSPPP